MRNAPMEKLRCSFLHIVHPLLERGTDPRILDDADPDCHELRAKFMRRFFLT
jgi:hypothetical protein